MLKRTQILLSLTIVTSIVVSLFIAGCGGHNSTAPFGSSGQQSLSSRQENDPPSAPTPYFPFDGYTILGGQILFVMRATDPNGDPLKYRVELLQNGNVVLVFDQTQSTQGWSKPVYQSGEWARLLAPVPEGTYQWRVKAYDGKEWGPFNNPIRTVTSR
jgi:hypothetical protein